MEIFKGSYSPVKKTHQPLMAELRSKFMGMSCLNKLPLQFSLDPIVSIFKERGWWCSVGFQFFGYAACLRWLTLCSCFVELRQ